MTAPASGAAVCWPAVWCSVWLYSLLARFALGTAAGEAFPRGGEAGGVGDGRRLLPLTVVLEQLAARSDDPLQHEYVLLAGSTFIMAVDIERAVSILKCTERKVHPQKK